MKLKLIHKKKLGKFQTPWAPLSLNFDYKDIMAKNGVENLLPIVSTIKSGKEFIDNPSLSNAASFGLDALGDVSTFGAGKLLYKMPKYLNKQTRAWRLADKIDKFASTSQHNYFKYDQLAKKYNDAVESLSLLNRPFTQISPILNKRNKSKRIAKYSENTMNKYWATHIKRTNPYDRVDDYKDLPFLIATNPGFHAASLAIDDLNMDDK